MRDFYQARRNGEAWAIVESSVGASGPRVISLPAAKLAREKIGVPIAMGVILPRRRRQAFGAIRGHPCASRNRGVWGRKSQAEPPGLGLGVRARAESGMGASAAPVPNGGAHAHQRWPSGGGGDHRRRVPFSGRLPHDPRDSGHGVLGPAGRAFRAGSSCNRRRMRSPPSIWPWVPPTAEPEPWSPPPEEGSPSWWRASPWRG